MTRVGVRDLRDRLSHYLKLVKAGEQVVVTERGKAIALLVSAERGGTIEVRDFVEFLLERRAAKLRAEKRGELKLDWRRALRDLRDRYTSVELQHKVLEWWGD